MTSAFSEPLMMNVPREVIIGKSPMYSSVSWMTFAFCLRIAFTRKGREYVRSLSLHSSSVFLGSPRYGFSNSRVSPSLPWPTIGEMSSNACVIPFSTKSLNDLRTSERRYGGGRISWLRP